jgi:hypothetical protein
MVPDSATELGEGGGALLDEEPAGLLELLDPDGLLEQAASSVNSATAETAAMERDFLRVIPVPFLRVGLVRLSDVEGDQNP